MVIGDGMDIVQFKDIRESFSLFCERAYTYLYVDRVNGVVCKLFEPDFIVNLLDNDYDLEELVLEGSKCVFSNDIIIPTDLVYCGADFCGYLMPFFDGVSVYKFFYDRCVSSCMFVDIFSSIERCVEGCSDIVFPDLLTDGNVLVNSLGVVKFIDFDGLQIGNYSISIFSNHMGRRDIYDNDKYRNGNLYTKELDIKSLLYLFIKLLLDFDMGIIDNYSGLSQVKQIDRFIVKHGIDNDDLVRKIRLLYKCDVCNEYLGDTLYDIFDNYFVRLVLDDGKYIKKLVRK